MIVGLVRTAMVALAVVVAATACGGPKRQFAGNAGAGGAAPGLNAGAPGTNVGGTDDAGRGSGGSRATAGEPCHAARA
ncbi:MAG: hypothetical protein JW940_37805 [Polyangiaceae bacterium]|nr:hypothetical protein [Polyangiaceae bacterium]